MPTRHALGLDIGLAKLKLCTTAADGVVTWTSRSLPYHGELAYHRESDFETGIPEVLGQVVGAETIDVAVAVMSSGYGYRTYREGVLHTMRVLSQALPRTRCYALSGDGTLVPAEAVAVGDASITGPMAFSNGLGAAHLACRSTALGDAASGIALDTGGSTTAVTPIVGGEFDPASLVDRSRQLDHRLRHGKLTWIGAQTTPLEALASEAPVGSRRYPVIPRGVTFDHVSVVLGLLPEDRARKLSLFGGIPSRATALRGLADAVNLDPDLVSEQELVELARFFHACAVERLAVGIEAAWATLPAGTPKRAMAFGLGARGLAIPALLRAGFDADHIVDAATLLSPELAEVASCYGAWHAGVELLEGHPLPMLPGPAR